MSWSETAVIIGFVLTVAVIWIWRSATRLDRLHRKVVASRIALDAQLVRRSSAARALATSGELDPVSSVIVADAVFATGGEDSNDPGATELLMAVPDLAALVKGHAPGVVIGQALGSGLDEARSQAESNLSATLRGALEDPDEVEALRQSASGPQMIDDLASSWYRVQLARRFHNEAVAQAQRVRRKPLVRMLRLAGNAAMPQMVDIEDAWPAALGHPGDHGRGAQA